LKDDDDDWKKADVISLKRVRKTIQGTVVSPPPHRKIWSKTLTEVTASRLKD